MSSSLPSGKSATVTRIHAGASSAQEEPNFFLGASGAMRRRAPPRMPPSPWIDEPATGHVTALDLAERDAERTEREAALIRDADRRTRPMIYDRLPEVWDREPAPKTDRGSFKTLALILLAVAAACGVAWWVLS